MKRYFDLDRLTDNNYCDDIDLSYMAEIPDDGKPYGKVNDEVIDISQTTEYILEQKAKLIQYEETKKAVIFSKVADSILTDDLQLKAGKITQAVHDSRLTAKLAIYKQAEDNFYTNTGLERPATIGV